MWSKLQFRYKNSMHLVDSHLDVRLYRRENELERVFISGKEIQK